MRNCKERQGSFVVDRFAFEEVELNPEARLPERFTSLLADLLRYSAEVMIELYRDEESRDPTLPRADMNDWCTSAFENAAGLLLRHALVGRLQYVEFGCCYRLVVPRERFREHIWQRHLDGILKVDDFNRALDAPLQLANQTSTRANAETIAEIINGLFELRLIEGPRGSSVWSVEVLNHVWFSANGAAVEAAGYHGENSLEQFYREAQKAKQSSDY